MSEENPEGDPPAEGEGETGEAAEGEAPADGDAAAEGEKPEGEEGKEGEAGEGGEGGEEGEKPEGEDGGDGEAKEGPPDTGVRERIEKDPLELAFLEPLPEKIEFHNIPKINDARSVWRLGMRKLEETFAEHIANMHLDFEDKAN